MKHITHPVDTSGLELWSICSRCFFFFPAPYMSSTLPFPPPLTVRRGQDQSDCKSGFIASLFLTLSSDVFPKTCLSAGLGPRVLRLILSIRWLMKSMKVGGRQKSTAMIDPTSNPLAQRHPTPASLSRGAPELEPLIDPGLWPRELAKVR